MLLQKHLLGRWLHSKQHFYSRNLPKSLLSSWLMGFWTYYSVQISLPCQHSQYPWTTTQTDWVRSCQRRTVPCWETKPKSSQIHSPPCCHVRRSNTFVRLIYLAAALAFQEVPSIFSFAMFDQILFQHILNVGKKSTKNDGKKEDIIVISYLVISVTTLWKSRLCDGKNPRLGTRVI